MPSPLSLPLLFVLLLLLPQANSQSPTPSPFKPEALYKNRFYHLSSDSPLRSKTPRSHGPTIHTLLNFITYIDAAVVASTKSRANTTTSETFLTTCNYRQTTRWAFDVATYHGLRGWRPPSDACISDVYGTGVSSGVSVQSDPARLGFEPDDVYNAVVARAKDVDDIAQAVHSALDLGWSEPNRPRQFVYNVRAQQCTHDYATFVRQNGFWYIASRFSNADKDRTLGPNERRFVHEYLRADQDGNLLPSKTMRLPIRRRPPVEGVEPVWVGNSTTLLEISSGGVSASGFGTVFAADNIALEDALRKGGHATQQASDATTPSNIAILALPLAMNVVPVALVADVNGVGMLVYTLLTDVLTAVPLAIKGVEVLAIGSKEDRSVVTRISGADLDNSTKEKAAEIWIAQCVASGNLRPTGIVLLVVAVVFMIGGIVAEFVARSWVKKRRKLGKVDAVVGHEDGQGVQAAAMVMAREGAHGAITHRTGRGGGGGEV